MIATLSARTGIAPLALRDLALEDDALLMELAAAAHYWTPELELQAAGVEVAHETLRVVLALGGSKRIPPPLAIPRDRELSRRRSKPTPVSIADLAALTGRSITRAEP